MSRSQFREIRIKVIIAEFVLCIQSVVLLCHTECIAVEAEQSRQAVIVDECLSHTSQYAAAIQSLALEYETTFSWNVDGPAMQSEVTSVVFKDGLFYARFIPVFPQELTHSMDFVEEAYDGEIYYKGGQGKRNNYLWKFLGERGDTVQESWAQQCHLLHYLLGAGYDVPEVVALWKHSAKCPIQSILARYLKEGDNIVVSVADSGGELIHLTLRIPEPAVASARKINLEEFAKSNQFDAAINEVIDGLKRLRDSTDLRRMIELTIDPSKGFAIVRRRESTPEGRLLIEASASAHQQYGEQNLWLPTQCEVNTYCAYMESLTQITETPYRTAKIKLNRVDFAEQGNVAFSLQYPQGSMITDWSASISHSKGGGPFVYHQPAAFDKLDEVARIHRQGNNRLILIIVNVAIFSGLLVVWTRRNRNHPHA